MKKILLILGVFVALVMSASAVVTISLQNGDDDGAPAKVITYERWKAAHSGNAGNTVGLMPESVPLLSTLPNRIYQLSGPSASDSHTAEFRQNVMKWLGGLTVPTERSLDPTAVYTIPRFNALDKKSQMWGLQLYDATSTGFPFWCGQAPPSPKSPLIASATGHRITVPLILSTNQMRKYWVRVTSTSPTIGNAMFPVATNSANLQEIAFNPQYIGLGPGEDGEFHSFADPSTGQWVKVGDDEILTSGFPSGLEGHYKTVLRFGSTIAVSVSDYASFATLKNEFASNRVSLKVELVLKDVESEIVLDSYTTMAALPGLQIQQVHGRVYLSLVGGQDMLVHQLETRPDLDSETPWANAHSDALSIGREWFESSTNSSSFFRVRQLGNNLP